jgi:hypothetical protein
MLQTDNFILLKYTKVNLLCETSLMCMVLLCVGLTAKLDASEKLINFNRDIRPILWASDTP